MLFGIKIQSVQKNFIFQISQTVPQQPPSFMNLKKALEAPLILLFKEKNIYKKQ
jgi:hypothetical protein